jgi:hypothetical protein
LLKQRDIAASSPVLAQSRSFYDGDGKFAGSATTYNGGRDTSLYDRDGHFSGSIIRNRDGTTSFYDRNGHFTGSSTSTTLKAR